MTRGVELARDGAQTGRLDAYLAFESEIFPRVAGWGATLYTLGALGWTVCFAAGGAWSRGLSWLSVAVWGLFGVVSPGLLLAPDWRLPASVVSGANAVGFVLMEVWFVWVALKVRDRRGGVSRALPPAR